MRKRRKTTSYHPLKRSIKSGLAPGTPVFVGERKQDDVQISIMTYSHDGVEELRSATLEDCRKSVASDSIRWININGLHDVKTIETLTRQFSLHPLTLEDIVNSGQRPKAEEFHHYIFLVLKMLSYDDARKTFSIENISLILGENYVISFQEKKGDLFDPIRDRIRTGKGRLRSSGADFLAYSLMDAVLDGYFIAIEKLGDHIEEVDEAILAGNDTGQMAVIHRMKRELLYLRKSVWPLREEISQLEKSSSPLISAATKTFLRDLYDHNIQVIDMVETYRDILGGMHDTYLSSISHRMNEVMKVLTIIATIFIPLTFVAGVYGMNFQYMPELEWRYGYFVVMGIMAVIGGGLLVYFRKRKWI
ncbi:MAG: magnesium/cobalt transporter CorA [Pseudohongiellaceae bacterium]